MELGGLRKTTQVRSSPLEAMKRILRMIRLLKLAPGDRLPTQAEIRKTLGLTNFVIDDAMESLKGYGAVSRSRANGTLLLGLEHLPLEIFNVAVLSLSPGLADISPYSLNVFSYLTIDTLKAGLGCRPFVSRRRHEDASPFREEDFSGLKYALDCCSADIVLTPVRLYGDVVSSWESSGVPCVDMSHNGPGSSVIVDSATMVEDSLRRLRELGCSRFGIINMDAPKHDHDLFWKGFENGLSGLGLPHSAGMLLSSEMLTGERGGSIVADKFMALNPEERPDGVVSMDDRLAISFERALLSRGFPMPKLTTQFNIQAPVDFRSHVLKYGLDIDAFARLAVDSAIKRLTRPDLQAPCAMYRLLPLNF